MAPSSSSILSIASSYPSVDRIDSSTGLLVQINRVVGKQRNTTTTRHPKPPRPRHRSASLQNRTKLESSPCLLEQTQLATPPPSASTRRSSVDRHRDYLGRYMCMQDALMCAPDLDFFSKNTRQQQDQQPRDGRPSETLCLSAGTQLLRFRDASEVLVEPKTLMPAGVRRSTRKRRYIWENLSMTEIFSNKDLAGWRAIEKRRRTRKDRVVATTQQEDEVDEDLVVSDLLHLEDLEQAQGLGNGYHIQEKNKAARKQCREMSLESIESPQPEDMDLDIPEGGTTLRAERARATNPTTDGRKLVSFEELQQRLQLARWHYKDNERRNQTASSQITTAGTVNPRGAASSSDPTKNSHTSTNVLHRDDHREIEQIRERITRIQEKLDATERAERSSVRITTPVHRDNTGSYYSPSSHLGSYSSESLSGEASSISRRDRSVSTIFTLGTLTPAADERVGASNTDEVAEQATSTATPPHITDKGKGRAEDVDYLTPPPTNIQTEHAESLQKCDNTASVSTITFYTRLLSAYVAEREKLTSYADRFSHIPAASTVAKARVAAIQSEISKLESAEVKEEFECLENGLENERDETLRMEFFRAVADERMGVGWRKLCEE